MGRSWERLCEKLQLTPPHLIYLQTLTQSVTTWAPLMSPPEILHCVTLLNCVLLFLGDPSHPPGWDQDRFPMSPLILQVQTHCLSFTY